jgi:hypothetical protein
MKFIIGIYKRLLGLQKQFELDWRDLVEAHRARRDFGWIQSTCDLRLDCEGKLIVFVPQGFFYTVDESRCRVYVGETLATMRRVYPVDLDYVPEPKTEVTC